MNIVELLKPSAIAEILGISVSGVYSKLKRENGNRFSEADIMKIKKYVSERIKSEEKTES